MTFRYFSILFFTAFFATLVNAQELVNDSKRLGFSLADVEALPPLPDYLWKLEYSERISNLENNLSKASDPLYRYQYFQALVLLLGNRNMNQDLAPLCRNYTVLREDYLTRGRCLRVLTREIPEYEAAMERLIEEASATRKHKTIAQLFKHLAWHQSQAGRISPAFVNYERALAYVPPDDIELANDITFDAVSNYIAHGNDFYVRKGVNLLEAMRNANLKLLRKVDKREKIASIKHLIGLTYFNSGIAYVLHLYEYENALTQFEPLQDLNNDIGANAVTFLAFIHAHLGNYEQASHYLDKGRDLRDGNAAIDQYLLCYRELAEQHWNRSKSVNACLNLHIDTALEVKLDIFKRLSQNPDPTVELYGLRALRDQYLNHVEKQFREGGMRAASNVEIQRLKKESELKTTILEQKEKLRNEQEISHKAQQKFLVALFFAMIAFTLIIFFQLQNKKKLAQQYQRLSTVDALTGLGNRRYLEQHIGRELAFIKREQSAGNPIALGIFLFDVDHFKKVNDTYGHDAGDAVLEVISARVSALKRETDLLVRWGGEEFMLVARVENQKAKQTIGNRLLKAINDEPIQVPESDLALSISCTIGIVEYPFINTEQVDCWTRLVSLADAALYHGKHLGRNCWVTVENKTISQLEELNDLFERPLADSAEAGQVQLVVSAKNNNGNRST